MASNSKKQPIWVRVIDGISEWSGYLSGICIMLASLVVFHQVIVRYFLGLPTVWQTELTIYLLMFATFIGGAYGLKHNAHVGVDVITEMLSHKTRVVIRIVTSLLCFALIVILAYRGWEMWWEATREGWTSATLWGPKLTYPYLLLPLGMSLISLQYVALIYKDMISLRECKFEIHNENTTVQY